MNSDERIIPVHFWRFIKKLYIGGLEFSLEAKTFSSLKTLHLYGLYDTEIGYIQNILKNIENIRFNGPDAPITDGFIKRLCEYIPKLKSLQIDEECVFERGLLKAIFSQQFPSLEHLDCRYSSKHLNGIKAFLECHTKLKHFECFDSFLWSHRDVLKDTNVRLDVLTIEFRTKKIQTDEFADLLRQLFQSGFFKTIHLSFRVSGTKFDSDALNRVISKWPALEKLCDHWKYLDLSRLENLKELRELEFMGSPATHDKIAEKLLKLEQLTLYAESIDDILPFIRHCKRLKMIKLRSCWSDDLKLISLNQERKNIEQIGENTYQLWIYLPGEIYLREKWKSKNVNLSHIKIARLDIGDF